MDTVLSRECCTEVILGYSSKFRKEGFGIREIATALARLEMSADLTPLGLAFVLWLLAVSY